MPTRYARFATLTVATLAVGCSDTTGPLPLPDGCSDLVTLDRPLGAFLRLEADDAGTFPCLHFDPAASAGHEYLLLLENLSPSGEFDAALFPGPVEDTTFAFSLEIESLAEVDAHRTLSAIMHSPPHAAPSADSWDFGAGRIREHHPALPSDARLGEMIALRADSQECTPTASAAVGDTICVLMDALPRLDITSGTQKAVVRFIAHGLMLAEDVRLSTTLVREGGGYNTPIAEEDFAAIAAEYAANGRVQGDLLFDGVHNLAVEASDRIVLVHSLMPADDLWGYTYSVSDYLVFDYWVATDGATKGLNQHPQRIADNLLMHEIAHMRHVGLLQHNGLGISQRGNRWLVEGFARFAERLPIAARLLGTTLPSRTANVVLPRNPAFDNAYFMDDVPTYLHASSSMYFGYHKSAFVFDWLADQVALAGGDWKAAVREVLLAGSSEDALDDVLGRRLPGSSSGDVVSRARIALYTDDIGTPGLPDWTQYHQFQLRESRPAREQDEALDPRAQWTRLSPASPTVIAGNVPAGAAAGYIIAGTAADPAAIVRVSGPAQPNATISLARIR